MSKERATRRAERAAQLAHRALEREQAAVAEARRLQRRNRIVRWLPSAWWRRRTGPLAARRRRARGLLVLAFVVVQLLTWVSTPDWGVRTAVLIASVFAVPVVALFTLP